MIVYLRMMLAPITVRFLDTHAMIAALGFLEEVPYDTISPWQTRYTKRVIAKELIRRNIFFWEK